MDISAVIITYNEEERLEDALKSLAGLADEVIVVDSFSTDKTLEVARKYTKLVYQRKWINFADQKNFANNKASFSWILSLDADERVSSELREEILQFKESEPDYSGFSIPRQVFYLGKWIRHSGWYPDRKIRLFRKEAAHWEGEYIHEQLMIKGKVEKLKSPIHHFTYRTIADHLDRINEFSRLGAQKLYTQRKKTRLYHLVILPFLRFIKCFFLRLGFLDGFAGLVISVLNSYAVFIRYAKLREVWKKGKRIEPFSH